MIDEGVVETGEVVGVGPGSADVRITANDACEGCGHCSRVDKGGMVLTDVRNDLSAGEGDRVEVLIPSGSDLRAGAYVYIGPVAALLLGYGVGNTVGRMIGWDPDTTGAIVAVMGVVAGSLFMRSRARKVLVSERFRPRLRAIIASGREPERSQIDPSGPVSASP
jgi:positive regulator of sigma E activity